MSAPEWSLLLAAALRVSAPLLLAALGETVSEAAGIINIGLEAYLLVSAFAAAVVTQFTQNAWLGLLAGVGCSLGLAALFGLLVVPLRCNQVVVGAAMNLLALGATGTLYRGIFGVTGKVLSVPLLPAVSLGPVERLPLLGGVLHGQNALPIGGLLIAPLLWALLYRTRAGLVLRSLGERPEAADTAGFSVGRWRFGAVLAGGALAGVGGAYLSIGDTGTFIEGMSSGRGFVALAIVIFGRWNPLGVLAASLFYGLMGALQFHVQALGAVLPWGGAIPHQFILMLPQVMTLVVLAGLAGRARQPQALGIPYDR
ncbi:MAG TPA: ABC transporter permease [Armatimonadota bacterium]|jgi:simple sugar transport system permease protein